MPHEIDRVLRAVAARAWFIEPRKAEELFALLLLRAEGPTGGGYAQPANAQTRELAPGAAGGVAVVPLIGVVAPRADMFSDMSGGASLSSFQRRFEQAAQDPNVSAIVLEIDSPGGAVDQVPETAAMIRKARNAERPIVAVANTLAASAAYWIATAADELVVTPSGEVGSIGVYTVHQDVSERLALEGVNVTVLSEGPRKVEGHPWGPLDDTARTAMQASVRAFYDMFVSDVAKARGVPQARVRADPEMAERHFGGGRTYLAAEAVRLGMADRVGTLADTIARLRGGARRPRR